MLSASFLAYAILLRFQDYEIANSKMFWDQRGYTKVEN